MGNTKIGIDAHEIEKRPTGVGRVLLSILKEWDKFDLNEIEFILYFKEEIPNLDLSEKFERKLLNSRSNAFFMHYHLSKTAKKDKVDLLFCPGYVAPLFYKGNIALELHDIIYQARPELYNWPSIWDKFLLKTISRISARKANIILTCSQFSKKEIIKHYQVNPEKVKAIYLATDEKFKPKKEGEEEFKRKYGIKNKYILYLGSIFNRRHLPETISAFKKIAQEKSNYQFLIIGKNHTSPFIDIEKMVKETNQELKREGIIRNEYIDEKDLVSAYSLADLFVYLSDYEGFGLPVLESISCGTPTITSRKASIPEVANQSVIYVENNEDEQEIYQTIKEGLENQELKENLTKKGLEQSKKFSWQKTAKETLDALLFLK